MTDHETKDETAKTAHDPETVKAALAIGRRAKEVHRQIGQPERDLSKGGAAGDHPSQGGTRSGRIFGEQGQGAEGN